MNIIRITVKSLQVGESSDKSKCYKPLFLSGSGSTSVSNRPNSLIRPKLRPLQPWTHISTKKYDKIR